MMPAVLIVQPEKVETRSIIINWHFLSTRPINRLLLLREEKTVAEKRFMY